MRRGPRSARRLTHTTSLQLQLRPLDLHAGHHSGPRSVSPFGRLRACPHLRATGSLTIPRYFFRLLGHQDAAYHGPDLLLGGWRLYCGCDRIGSHPAALGLHGPNGLRHSGGLCDPRLARQCPSCAYRRYSPRGDRCLLHCRSRACLLCPSTCFEILN